MISLDKNVLELVTKINSNVQDVSEDISLYRLIYLLQKAFITSDDMVNLFDLYEDKKLYCCNIKALHELMDEPLFSGSSYGYQLVKAAQYFVMRSRDNFLGDEKVHDEINNLITDANALSYKLSQNNLQDMDNLFIKSELADREISCLEYDFLRLDIGDLILWDVPHYLCTEFYNVDIYDILNNNTPTLEYRMIYKKLKKSSTNKLANRYNPIDGLERMIELLPKERTRKKDK